LLPLPFIAHFHHIFVSTPFCFCAQALIKMPPLCRACAAPTAFVRCHASHVVFRYYCFFAHLPPGAPFRLIFRRAHTPATPLLPPLMPHDADYCMVYAFAFATRRYIAAAG